MAQLMTGRLPSAAFGCVSCWPYFNDSYNWKSSTENQRLTHCCLPARRGAERLADTTQVVDAFVVREVDIFQDGMLLRCGGSCVEASRFGCVLSPLLCLASPLLSPFWACHRVDSLYVFTDFTIAKDVVEAQLKKEKTVKHLFEFSPDYDYLRSDIELIGCSRAVIRISRKLSPDAEAA